MKACPATVVRDPRSCTFGNPNGPEIDVYGDSLGIPLLAAVVAAYGQDYKVRGLTKIACAVNGADANYGKDEWAVPCVNHRNAVVDYVRQAKPAALLMIETYAWATKLKSKATGDAMATEWTAADQRLVDQVRDSVGHVVVVSPSIPGVAFLDCYRAGGSPSRCVTGIPTWWQQAQDAERRVQGATFLDTLHWYCVDGRCPIFTTDHDTVLKGDYLHPSVQYMRLVADDLRYRLAAAASCPDGTSPPTVGSGTDSGMRVASSPRAAVSCGMVRNRASVRSAPRRSAPRRSAPRRSAHAEVGASQVGPDEQRTAQVGAPQRLAAQVATDQVLTAEDPATQTGAHRRAHPAEQIARPPAERIDVEGAESFGSSPPTGRRGASPHRRPTGRRSPGTARVLASARYHRISCTARSVSKAANIGPATSFSVPPRATAERDLHDLLSGPEAVEDLTPREALGPESVVDPAPVVVPQVTARHTGRLVDGEVGRARERQCDATESGAATAVGPQLRAPVQGVGRHPRRLRR